MPSTNTAFLHEKVSYCFSHEFLVNKRAKRYTVENNLRHLWWPYCFSPIYISQILKCKELPEYPGNMTCSDYQEYKRKEPGLIARVGTMVKNTWSFLVTTVVEAWKMCSNGVGTTAKNIWNALKWLIDLACNIWKGTLEWVGRIWKGLTDCVGEIWNRLKRLAEWIFPTMMWADECVYHGGLWVAERYWVCAEWLAACAWNGTEWIWDQIEWLNGVSKENASWLTKKAWIGSKQWAEWAWGEAKRLIDWSWKTIKRNGKPLEPALENVLETFSLFIKFYNEYIHGESKAW